jgi:hypothetical protein
VNRLTAAVAPDGDSVYFDYDAGISLSASTSWLEVEGQEFRIDPIPVQIEKLMETGTVTTERLVKKAPFPVVDHLVKPVPTFLSTTNPAN